MRFMDLRVTALIRWCWVAMAVGLGASTVRADAREDVQSFYGWYMARMVADDPPILSDKGELKRYVSTARLRKLYRQFNSADGMESDYFMQSQDYLDSWTRKIIVVPVSESAKRAELQVQLGEGDELRRLEVWAIQEAGRWKIDAVRLWRLP